MSEGRTLQLVATTTLGAEEVLVKELQALGARDLVSAPGAVRFTGGHRVAYRVCFRSRCASRVLVVLRRFPAPDAQALYDGVRGVRWSEHLGPDDTLRVDAVGTHERLRNERFTARAVKDAIVDQLREETGSRPSVDLTAPTLRVHLHLAGPPRRSAEPYNPHRPEPRTPRNAAYMAQVAVDLVGAPLHMRGHRVDGGPAPLKETLAGVILSLAGWPEAAAAGAPLVDPMCGSGTLAIEAAEIALGLASGRSRDFAFTRWRGFDSGAWRSVQNEPDVPLNAAVAVYAWDNDPAQIARLNLNAAAAGVARVISVNIAELADAVSPEGPVGLVVTNPPYGERLGAQDDVSKTWELLGNVLRQHFLGWHAWILAGSTSLAKRLGLRPSVRHAIHNGPLDCRLLGVPISEKPPVGRRW